MRLGILGGTFDPVHNGHLFVAREVRRAFQLDQVLLMVAPQPPHKRPRTITAVHHRYAMAVLATRHDEAILASDLELEREGSSFTWETLAELRKRIPSGGLVFIAGSDSLREIHLWRRYDTLFSEYCLVFVQRSGAEIDLNSLELEVRYRRLIQGVECGIIPSVDAGNHYFLELDTPSVSSTAIRRSLLAGLEPDEECLDPAVINYIRKYRLYGSNQGSAENRL
jgi:nicotinate-nucleotide adenylyltransferase